MTAVKADPEAAIAQRRARLEEVGRILAKPNLQALYAEREQLYCELAELGVPQQDIAAWASSKPGAVWAALQKAEDEGRCSART